MQRPQVGMGILVMRGGKVLLGRRRGSHGTGYYAAPGSHLEFGERFAAAAAREVREETGLEITGLRLLTASNLKQLEFYNGGPKFSSRNDFQPPRATYPKKPLDGLCFSGYSDLQVDATRRDASWGRTGY